MMKRSLLLLSLLGLALSTNAQQRPADSALRKGNMAYKKGRMDEAAKAYEQAAADERGSFNLGNALYRQEKFGDAQQRFEGAVAATKDANAQSRALHNLGNSWMQQQKYEEAVNAYKQALRRQPADEGTRYNLAYAQKKLEQEEQKKKPDQQQDQQQQPQEQKQDQQQQQPKPNEIGKQDAERMLEAMEQQEKNTQDKVRGKAKGAARKPIEKDW